MKIPWKRIGIGLKVLLNIAIDLNDHGIIKVKELNKAKEVKDIIESNINDAKKPKSPQPVRPM